MSLLGSILSVAAPIIGTIYGGPIGGAIGTAIGGAMNAPPPSMPGSGAPAPTPTMGSLPSVVGAAGTAIVAGGKRVMSSAITYCRKHPGWCANVGGVAAVAAMVSDGRLPKLRTRRARGISAGEFKGFRKVHKVLSGFCAPRFKIRKSKRSC